MNEEQLKKKLSVLKSVPVPKGYWEGYWPRLLGRINSTAQHHPSPQPSPLKGEGVLWRFLSLQGRGQVRDGFFPRVLVPAFAALVIGLGGYWWGRQSGLPPMKSNPDIHLTSDTGESQAQHVFKQMLELFPKRVNWISFQDGKVDFSISSVAYPDSQVLIPLVVTLPRAKEPFEARILIRPGQAARVEGAWDKTTDVAIHIQVSPNGRKATMSCRLNGSGLDTEVDISKDGTQPLGSFRLGERLVQAQLTRVKK